MQEFYPFFLILFAGVLFSTIYSKFHLPWVIALILGGIVIGPHGFKVISITPTIEFIGNIGLVFLMFMAGIETNVSSLKSYKKDLIFLSFINGFIPCLIGIGISKYLGYNTLTSLLVGAVFISSSVAVVIPTLYSKRMLNTKLGKSVVVTTVIQDVASLILLSILLQSINPITTLPLPVFYLVLFLNLAILKLIIPKIQKFFAGSLTIKSSKDSTDIFQQELRVVFLILIGTVVSFELLGLHPIVAGFFAGLILSSTITSEILKEKIRAISYGVFIPTFFIMVGAQTNISIFSKTASSYIFVTMIVLGSIVSKFASGYLGGKVVGFSNSESAFFASSSIPQLSTTLAASFTAASYGFFDDNLLVSMIVLSVVTTFISPTLMSVSFKSSTK